MALRVLLADESLNVKKNMQLCLQDFGVEIKTVLSGEEVGSSTRTFKPDLIFLDILLAKINGYDACSQLKNHPDFRHIPVLLTWSSFMEIDETKFKLSRADGRLEKPFDKDNLRKVVQHFVPKSKSQKLSEFLSFPDLRSFDSTEGNQESSPVYSQTLSHFTPKGNALSELGIEDEPDEFQHAPPPFQLAANELAPPPSFESTTPEISPLTSTNEDTNEWTPHKIHSSIGSQTKSKIQTPPMEESFEVEIANIKLPENMSIPMTSTPDLDLISPASTLKKPRTPTPATPQASKPSTTAPLSPQNVSSLSLSTTEKEALKKSVQSEIKPLIEETLNKILPELLPSLLPDILKKMLPEMAERLIREEIQKLMNETHPEN